MYTTKHPLSTYLGLPIYRDLTLEQIDVFINPDPAIIEGIHSYPDGRSRGE